MLFDYSPADVDEDLRRQDRAERERYRPHWCSTCHGFTGPNSPCYSGDEEDDEQQDEDQGETT